MIRVLVAVMVMAFATMAEAGIYRCTIQTPFDGFTDQPKDVLDQLSKQYNPIILNTQTGFVRFGRVSKGRQWTIGQVGDENGQGGGWDWEFVRRLPKLGKGGTYEIIRLRFWTPIGHKAKGPRFTFYTEGSIFAGRCKELH